MERKSDLFRAFLSFEAVSELESGCKIISLMMDGGGENLTREWKDYLTRKGIQLMEMNGIAERLIRVLTEHASAMLWEAKLPMGFWAAAMSTANYLRNRSPTTALSDDVTPYQAWYNKTPGLGHIRIFGCKAFAHVPVQIRSKTTWDSHSSECLLIGYSDTENLYELWDVKKGVAIRKRDVIFCEKELGSSIFLNTALPSGRLIFNFDNIPTLYADQHLRENPRVRHPSPAETPVLDTYQRTAQQSVDKLPEITTVDKLPEIINGDSNNIRFMEPVVQEVENPVQYTNVRFVDPNEHLAYLISTEEDHMLFNHLMFNALHLTTSMKPTKFWQHHERLSRTYHEAIVSTDAHQWLQAMNIQLKKLCDAGTWDLVFLPPGKRAIANKWVFSRKDGAKATMETELLHTARLVARGDLQSKGVDYDETFAPVVKLVSLRLLLTHAARMDLDIQHWDIIAAFLNGEITQDVYMKQPMGFEDGTARVCKLNKSIYGLCQSARAFYQKLDAVLKNMKWTRINTE